MSKGRLKRSFGGKRDILILAAVIILALSLAVISRLSSGKGKVFAEIYLDSEKVKTIELGRAKDEVFTLDENPKVTVEIKGKRIRFIESKCPDHICEQYGFIDKPGQTAVCMPNRAVIKITSTDKAPEFDRVT